MSAAAASGGPLVAVERLGVRGLAGIDLTGFSGWVAAGLGADGLEAVADETAALLEALGGVLERFGFRPAFGTGDGLVAVAAVEACGAREALAAAVRGLEPAARVAVMPGELSRAVLPGLNGRPHVLLFGEGVAAVHAALAAAPRAAGLARPARALPAAAKLGGATLAAETVGFLCAPLDVLGTVGARLPAWQAAAAAAGGALEGLAHDDAGLLLRFGWPAAAEGAARAMLAEAAGELGCGGAGVSVGPVFRGGAVACGAAINAAAKAAKRGARVAGGAAAERMPAPRLVGRDAELSRLEALLDAPGEPVVLEGEPGMGKSALLAALAGRAPAVLVAARPAACLDVLGLWGAALDAVRGAGAWAALAAGVDARDPGAPPAARLAARADALLEALRGAGRLLFDDVQWADAESLRLARRAAAAGVPVLLARRPDEEGGAADARTLVLGPLKQDDAAALMRAAGGRAEQAELAAGNPLHALQLSYAGEGEGAGSLDAVLDARVAALTGDARAAMRLLAVVGRAVPQGAWSRFAHALGFGDARGLLVGRAYAVRDGEGTAAAHRLLAERVLAQTPPSVRRALHWAVAGAASAGWLPGARPGEVAAHWAAAGAPARAAVAFARDAEAALAAGGFDAAARLFAEGLAAHAKLPDAPARRAALAGGLGMARWGLGDARGAAAAAAEGRGAVERALGRRAGGVRMLLALRGQALRPRLRAAVHRVAVLDAELGYFRGDMRAYAAGAMVALGGGGRDAAVIKARGVSGLAVLLGMLGFGRLAVLVAAPVRRRGDVPAVALVDAGEAIWRAARGDWARAEAALDRVVAARPERFDPQLAVAQLCLRALVEQMQGRLADAAATFDALHRQADALGHRQGRAWALYGGAMPAVARGDAAGALDMVRRAQAELADNDDRLSDLNCLALAARARWLAGDADGALEAAREATELAARLQPVNFGSLEGFTGAALALGAMARSDARGAAAFPAALRQARRFARLFPIGRPRAKLAAAMAAGDARGAAAAARMAWDIGMVADAAMAEEEAKRCRPI